MSRSQFLKLFQRIPPRVAIQTHAHITPLTARPPALNPLYRSYHYFAPLPLTAATLRYHQLHQGAPSYNLSQTPTPRTVSLSSSPASIRSLTSSPQPQKGLSPESEEPKPKIAEDNPNLVPGGPADITDAKYHELSDEYLNSLVEKLEQLQEECEEVDCEYSSGVLTLTFPPAGTYVINKQPPNKQIWLSSPITGPKRYNYVVLSEGQDSKEGTGSGEWVYLRDGTTLNALLEKEIGVDMSNFYAPVPHRGD